MWKRSVFFSYSCFYIDGDCVQINLHSFPIYIVDNIKEMQQRFDVLAAHRSSTNRFYTRSVLHNLFNTQQFLHGLITPEAWSYTKLLCMIPATDPIRGVSHVLRSARGDTAQPRFNTTRFYTSVFQHNPFLHISFSPHSWSCTTVPRFCTRTYLRQIRQEGAMAYLHYFLSLIFFLFEASTIVWHGFKGPYTYSQMNSVDALGATYNSESLNKVTKELTRVTSFITLSRDSRMSTLFI